MAKLPSSINVDAYEWIVSAGEQSEAAADPVGYAWRAHDNAVSHDFGGGAEFSSYDVQCAAEWIRANEVVS